MTEISPSADIFQIDRPSIFHWCPFCFHRFAVVPKANRQSSEVNVKGLTGILQVLRPAPEGAPGDRKCLRTYDFDIEPAVVNEYFYVQPDLMEEAEDTQLESSDSSSTTTSKPPRRPRDWAAVERLTKALRMNTNGRESFQNWYLFTYFHVYTNRLDVIHDKTFCSDSLLFAPVVSGPWSRHRGLGRRVCLQPWFEYDEVQ